MAKDNKISLPSGMGGLTRYFDESKSKIELSPQHVILIIIIVIVISLLLHHFGNSIFGL